VTAKLSASDSLLSFMLSELEKAPGRCFSSEELCRKNAFAIMKSLNFIKEAPFRPLENITFVDSAGQRRRIRKINGKYWSIPAYGSISDREAFSESAVRKWQFNVSAFTQHIKDKNGISKHAARLNERVHLIGECVAETQQVAVCIGLFSEDAHLECLPAIKSGFTCDSMLVLCPTCEIQDVGLRTNLERCGIYCFTFAEIIKSDDFVINFSRLRKPAALSQLKFAIPELNATERKQYAKIFPRRDVIEFTNRKAGERACIVAVNGNDEPLNYPEFIILLRLAIESKKKTGEGWVPVEDMMEAGIVNPQDKKAVGRIVPLIISAFKSHIEKNSVPIVQNLTRAGKYRLTTMPSRIKTPDGRWLGNKYAQVLREVIKEREKRTKKNEAAKDTSNTKGLL